MHSRTAPPPFATDADLGTPRRNWSVTDLPARARDGVPSTILLLSLLVLLLAAPERLMDDPDTLWHVEVGRWIWTNKTVPWTDLFSHTFAGAPWIAKEWLSQLILFAAYRAAGWSGVVLVAATAIAAAFAILHEWLRRRVNASVALAATLLAALLACPHFLARPHMLVLPIVILWMTALVAALDRRSAPPLPLALLMAAWANMHGSFPLGLVMAAVLAGEGILNQPRGSRLASLWRWGLFLALSLGATMLSPYGWHTLAVPLQMSGNNETLRFISEWQPLHPDLVGVLALGLLAAILAILAWDARANLFRIAAVALLAYLMIRHVRFVGLFATIAPILAARTLATRWNRSVRPGVTPRLRPLDAAMVLTSLIAAGVILTGTALALALSMRPQPEPRYAPEAALRFAAASGVTGPVYNDYDFGGYLIAHGIKTFIDGRADQLFLGDFLPALDRALKSKSDRSLEALLNRHHARWALVRSGSAAAGHLTTMAGWTRIYQDDVAAVFARQRTLE